MVERIIPIEKRLKEQLKGLKGPTDSYTDVIERLADEAEVDLDDGATVDTAAEQMAHEVMTAGDKLAADGPSHEYLKQQYDVDAADYDDVEQLRQAVREAPIDE